MTSISKKLYIDKFDDIVNKYNNTHHGAIKMKPVNVMPDIYIDFNKAINDKDPKFKAYALKWSAEVFVIVKVKHIAMWAINNHIDEEIVETFYEKELKKKIQKSLEFKE